MKYKKDNKLPNTKNVRRKTNPAGVTTIIQPKTATSGGGGPYSTGVNNLPQLPPGSLKQEPGQYGLTSL